MSGSYGHGPAVAARLSTWARQTLAAERAAHQRAADDAQHEADLRAEQAARHSAW